MDEGRAFRVAETGSDSGLVGSDVLQLVTTGMHSDPLSIFREYLQNAADSALEEGAPEQVRVDITFDLRNGRVTIRDDGPGVSYGQVRRSLLPVGRSRKTYGTALGFRGIGRLAGLAFARSVTFSTRDKRESRTTRVRWNGEALRAHVGAGETADEAIRQSVTVERDQSTGDACGFFEVTIDGVSRAASSAILNRERVASYVAQVCAVPFADEFPFVREVEQHVFSRVRRPRLEVYLDGAKAPVRRPHGPVVSARSGRTDSYGEFEPVHIARLDGGGSDDLMAVGWIAHSSYYGALPGVSQVRGIRVRSGDFQVGDERVFEHLFTEPRFNQWCVAEIHILDSRLRPNGRRDYFEPGPHLRHLENQMSRVCRRVERRCRGASQGRNTRKRVESVLAEAEDACELARLGYLTREGARRLLARQRGELRKVRTRGPLFNGADETDLMREVSKMEETIIHLVQTVRARQWKGMDPAEQGAYRRVFSVIAEVSASPKQARETIEAVVKGSISSA